MDSAGVRTFQSQLKALQRRQRREWTPVAGLTRPSIRVMGSIARHDGLSQPGNIADELQMTTSNVAAALRELEIAGLISRQRSSSDNRRVNVSLTAGGRRLVADSRSDRDGWLQSAIDSLLDEREQAVLAEAGRLVERLARFDSALAEPRAS